MMSVFQRFNISNKSFVFWLNAYTLRQYHFVRKLSKIKYILMYIHILVFFGVLPMSTHSIIIKNVAPIMTLNDDIFIEERSIIASSNIELTCEGLKAIRWILFHNETNWVSYFPNFIIITVRYLINT